MEHPVLWDPPAEFRAAANLTRYLHWLETHRNLHLGTYDELWQWSTERVEDFWASLWEFFEITASTPYRNALSSHAMPGARWFEGATLNYAEHVFRNATSDHPALLFQSERRALTEISWQQLQRDVAACAAALRGLGVRTGDRVVAYLPNIPQAVVAFLACASIGATWSSSSPDFGTPSVIDRFKQLDPTVLIAVDGYQYNGRRFDRTDAVRNIQEALPSLRFTIAVPYLDDNDAAYAGSTSIPGAIVWNDLLGMNANAALTFEPLPVDHPLWVVYSSGTTGLPKAIAHGHGGILLEHLKFLTLHANLQPGDRFFWFTTTGWIMWNILLGGLLSGASIVLYDGNPAYPDHDVLWRLAEQAKITLFGTSPAFIAAGMKAGVEPARDHDLRALRAVSTTGSPLTAEQFTWTYEHVKRDMHLASVAGGTEVATAFVGGCPLLPVRAGEIQCRQLGVRAEALDAHGVPLIDGVGELAILEPMPSMPLYFWNDPEGTRYRESYFTVYPGIWRHGDWISITPSGGVVIYGRSDATINRRGVRLGTIEIYRAVEAIDDVLESLVVDLEYLGRDSFMPLFVRLRENVALDDALRERIVTAIRERVSPRFVPDAIYQVPDVPKNLTGKRLEVPVKRVLLGMPLERSLSVDAVANPDALDWFVQFATMQRAAR
ncbi:acetoacetate--CoA ligase [bacterium]|nr:MAG: acetoacetate--CoA ligase [bacterium]